MSSLSKKILNKIHKEHIKPKPRWYFVLMHTLLWASVVATVLLGSLSVAIVLRHLLETDWMIVHRVISGKLGGFLVMLPYLWFLFIALVIFFANKLFIHTKSGYKFKPSVVVAVSVLISIIFGGLFYLTQSDTGFEQGLRRHMVPYARWGQFRERIFVAPHKGVLVGTVAEINSEVMIIIVDFRDDAWTVDISEATKAPEVKITVNERMGFLGEQTDVFTFKASEIRKFFRKSERK